TRRPTNGADAIAATATTADNASPGRMPRMVGIIPAGPVVAAGTVLASGSVLEAESVVTREASRRRWRALGNSCRLRQGPTVRIDYPGAQMKKKLLNYRCAQGEGGSPSGCGDQAMVLECAFR